jgi:hypothetical protein
MKTFDATRYAVWLSCLLCWGMGILFIAAGIKYIENGGWPAILFGLLIFVTGFFRPRRCVDERCEMKPRSK